MPRAQASLFGKIGIFAFAAWAGAQNGGVIAGLGVCGIFLSVTSAAAGALCTQSCLRARLCVRALESADAAAVFERADSAQVSWATSAQAG